MWKSMQKDESDSVLLKDGWYESFEAKYLMNYWMKLMKLEERIFLVCNLLTWGASLIQNSCPSIQHFHLFQSRVKTFLTIPIR